MKSIGDTITWHDFGAAELYWTFEVQSKIICDLKLAVNGEGRYKRLSLKKRGDGIYVVGKRIEVWNEMSYNRESIPLHPKEHRFSKLYAEMIHKSGHLGISTEVAKIRTRFWIVSIECIVKSIRFNCITCRKRNKQLASQIMSPLPLERLRPAPGWSSIGIDLFSMPEAK